MKLGFLLQITQAGNPSDGFSVNKEDSWARQASDVRTSIKGLNNYYGTEKVVYLLKFLGNIGYLICVIKASPEGSPRPDDNTAAWIFFPANIAITSDETINVLNTVEEAISQEKRTDYEQLERLFGKEYQSNDVLISAVGTINSKNDSTYAVRYYNADFTLKELLGTSIAQQEYGNYKGIILIDKGLNISHTTLKELNFEPRKICIYKPLFSVDGFKPCFLSQNQYRVFDQAIEVPIGTSIPIYWVRKGYAPINKTFVAEGGPECPESVKINPNEYKIIIPRKLFYVTDPNGIPVNQFDVRINHQLMEGDSMEVLEAYYNQGLAVSIAARGFAEWKRTGVHPQLDRQLTVSLSKQIFHYEFAIPVYEEGRNTNNDAIVIVETYLKLHSSPIKGYSLESSRIQEGEGRINRLFLDDKLFSKLKYMAYGFASCIFILLMYAGCNALENYEFNLGWPPIKEIKHAPKTDYNTANEGLEDVNQVDTDSVNALRYLEGNDTWHKDSLEKYEATRGLFEDLNTFDVKALMGKMEGVLHNSNKLSVIAEKLNEYVNEGKDPHKGKEKNSGNYNSSTDKGIDINNYLNWLSEEHASIEMFPASNPAPKEQKSQISGKIKESKTIPNPKPQKNEPKIGGSRGSLN